MDLERHNEGIGRQETEQPAVAKEDRKNRFKPGRKEKNKKMILFWILIAIPVIVFAFLIPRITSQVQNDTAARIHKALSEHPGLIEDNCSVSYEYYQSILGKGGTGYVAVARVTLNCKEGAQFQGSETDEIKNIFVQDIESRSILGTQVKIITPVTLTFKDGTAATFCQDSFALSDSGQNGGIISTEYYEPCAPPWGGIVVSAAIALVFWAVALGYYKKKIKITNELTDIYNEGGLHKMTHIQKY